LIYLIFIKVISEQKISSFEVRFYVMCPEKGMKWGTALANRKKNLRKSNYLEEVREWQAHQYDPGYYTGGRMPPHVLHQSPSGVFGYYYIIGGLLLILLMGYIAVICGKNSLKDVIIVSLFIDAIGLLHILAGAKLLKKGKPNNGEQHNIRTWR